MKEIKPRWRIYVLFLSLIAFLLFFFITKHLIINLYNEVNSRDWIKVQGKVIQFQMQTQLSGRHGDLHRYQLYKPLVAYKYQWNENTFIGRRVTWNETYENAETNSNDTLYAKGMYLKHAYQSNVNIDIYINPDKPEKSVLYRETSLIDYIINIFLSLLGAIPFLGLLYLSFSKTWFFLQ